MDPLNQLIFDDTSFSDLLKEIHGNQKKKAKQLASLIAELRPLVQSLGDATVVVPLIKEYMEISVKNDDQLIKMAAIVQRLSTSSASGGDGGLLTEDEMAQLQELTEEIAKTVESEPKQLDKPKEQNGI
jgi:hypothetical protein|tara:strand:+ start:460 stop:846 length:387 start_codon:yes stop_codon:yes gene_type:complete